MVAAFIRERGVTVCPAVGTPELAAINIEREKATAEKRRRNWGYGYGRLGRKPNREAV